MKQQKYMLISCAVLARECYYCASVSKNIIDLRILKQGLHDIGEKKMTSALQAEIDSVEVENYDAILLAYGLCNNGISNLHAEIPLVVPRAHDCITLLMGSKEEYQKYFNENPGTFFRSSGWIERSKDNMSNPESTTRQMGMGTYEEYVKTYGEENAKFLFETLGNHLKNYSRLTYIDTGMKNTEKQKEESKAWTEEENWEYSEYEGSMRLLSMLMNGDWNESEFLVINPGKTLRPSYDDGIIESV
jgi:hypothetical protein